MNVAVKSEEVRSARPEPAEALPPRAGSALDDAAPGEPPPTEPTPDEGPRSRRRFAWIGTLASLALFAASLFVLWHIASDVDGAKLNAAFAAADGRQIGLAAFFTALSYLFLTGYDALALRQLKVKVPYRTTALASFTSYAVSFNLGFPLITGGTVRYWIYAPRGLKAGHVASLTVIANLTFWLGMGAVFGWSLVSESGPLAVLTYTSIKLNQLLGLFALAVVAGYLVWVAVKRRVVRLQGWRLELPSLKVSAAQMVIGVGDVCAGAAVLFVLLPEGHGVGYESFLAVYVFAVMLGVASHSPGGLGVFEATILLALSSLAREPVLGALLLFRLIYYAVPFVCALALLGAYEVLNRMRVSKRMLDPREG